jgi:hypothetical protein
MGDLLFGIIMLTTFCSTFVFNGVYVRWQTGGGQQEAATAQSNAPPPLKNNDKKSEEQEKTTPTD